MAIDNLNVMTSWLPAGQQTDKYSTKPWCLRSKNLDIFSSSKSAKGTAWSEETETWSNLLYDDGVLSLTSDGKVYQYWTLFRDVVAWFPVYNVSYDWRNGTYNSAQRWNTKSMTVQYENWSWRAFTVFSDRATYTYNKVPYSIDTTLNFSDWLKRDPSWPGEYWSWWDHPLHQWYMFNTTSSTVQYCEVGLVFNTNHIGNKYLTIYANEESPSNCECDVYLYGVGRRICKYYYDAQTDSMIPYLDRIENSPTYTPEDFDIYQGIVYPLWIVWPAPTNWSEHVTLKFRFKQREGSTSYKRTGWVLNIWVLWWPEKWYFQKLCLDPTDRNVFAWGDHNEYYTYEPLNRNTLKNVWEYKWRKWSTVQTLYKRDWQWVLNENRQHVMQWDLQQYMAWENPTTMDVIDMISWNEKIYMIGNMDGNGYIIPCELTGWKGTPYIAYWCTFKGATNIDYLMYLVGEDRGISQLWCYNTQELVPLIWGDKKKVEVDSVTHEKADNDFIDTNEQYRFNWKMVEYRGDLVLATEDNRLFRYGQTAGGKGWSFIFDIPWEITDLRTENDNLIVSYEVTRTELDENEQEVEVTYKYNRTYQDDIADKNYLTEREAVYPIALWNHLLEKEESDLYTSYILPSKDCKLEFWGAGNHYHYRTFKVWNVVPWSWVSPTVALELLRTWKLQIAGTTWDYRLEYVEDDGTRFTYRLVGDLPQQTENSIKQLTKATTNHIDDPFYTFTEFHHFRKIGEITAEGYTEGEYRFHNLNNKLELPKTHSLQIMVKGTWTAEASPELFTVDLIANQRERW